MPESARWQRARRVAGFETCFTWYLRGLVRRSFEGVWVAGEAQLPRGGSIVAANHHSWWDGLIPYLVHRLRDPRAPFAIMMSDAELRRFPYFRMGGAFSVDARSVRAAREAVLYAADEARAGAAVWIFPDGVLRPQHAPQHFTAGFAHAARAAGVPAVPAAMRFVMRTAQRPEAFIRFGTPFAAGRDAAARAQHEVELLLAEIDDAIATDTVRERFRCAIEGRPGVDDRLALARR
jgi:1-acyl-sn-glycerol-3-phosphate acyltransferase